MDRQQRRPAARQLSLALGLALLVALAVVGLVRSAGADGPASAAEREHEIAASLRCPTCQGLSVADSSSPLSKSMRRIIGEQVAAGRSDDQVIGYFVDRYGEWVLLSPRADGRGWLVWALPVVAVLVGLVAAGQLVRRRRPGGEEEEAGAAEPTTAPTAEPTTVPPAVPTAPGRVPQGLRWLAGAGVLAAALGVLMATNSHDRAPGDLATGNVTPLGADTPSGADLPSGTGGSSGAGDPAEPQSRSGAATDRPDLAQIRAAVEKRPGDLRLRLALASRAFQQGRLGLVRTQADVVLERRPRNVDALMLRGLAARSRDDRTAREALRRFLRVAPAEHPAVPLVRSLLREGR